MPLTKPCGHCGEDFPVQCQARWERSKYCSHRCRQLGRFGIDPWDMTRVRKPRGGKDRLKARSCETCGAVYEPNGQKQRWCRVCAPDFSWSRRIQRYGLTKPQWDELLLAQGGTCALCSDEPTCVDHCHQTGRVRGLVCNTCNFKLGALDDIDWRANAEKYLAI